MRYLILNISRPVLADTHALRLYICGMAAAAATLLDMAKYYVKCERYELRIAASVSIARSKYIELGLSARIEIGDAASGGYTYIVQLGCTVSRKPDKITKDPFAALRPEIAV